MNKLVLAILLLMAVTLMGSFGFFAMGHHADHSGCIASLASNTKCEASSNGLQFADFHLSVFKTFTVALGIKGALLALFLFTLFWIRPFVLFRNRYLKDIQSGQFDAIRYEPRSIIVFLEYKLIRWLAIHENSPAYI